MFTPLEQFEVTFFPVFKLVNNLDGFLNTFFNNVAICLFFIVFFLLIFMFVFYKSSLFIPTIFHYVIEQVLIFIRFVIKDNLSENYFIKFPYLLSLFGFLLFCNFCGMITYTFTVTSHLIVTFTLGLISFCGLNIIGILKHGQYFVSLFLPNGAPLILAAFLIAIEIFSYFARVFSLAIRLFANLMSGHTLLRILSGFA